MSPTSRRCIDAAILGSVGMVAYRRVYLRQFPAWLKARGMSQPGDVTPRVLTGYLAHLRSRWSAPRFN
jgi:hypothetical protein